MMSERGGEHAAVACDYYSITVTPDKMLIDWLSKIY